MKDKRTDAKTALQGLQDGALIMVGGFGSPGTPFTLLDAVLKHGARDLTLVKNDANEPGIGVSVLMEAGRTKRFIVSHMGLNSAVIELMNRGAIKVEFHPQGILAEKIRAGGAGLLGIVTDIGLGTILERDREIVEVGGRKGLFEPALRADVALIHAARSDTFGNVLFAGSARNFNPLMAMAADLVVVEAMEIVPVGRLDPNGIHLPGAFVDAVVQARTDQRYEVMEHHVG